MVSEKQSLNVDLIDLDQARVGVTELVQVSRALGKGRVTLDRGAVRSKQSMSPRGRSCAWHHLLVEPIP